MAVIEPDDHIPPGSLARTVAHECQSVISGLGHAFDHAIAAKNAPDAEERSFNTRHALGHVTGTHDRMKKFLTILAAYDREIRAEIEQLDDVTSLTAVRYLDGGETEVIPPPDDDVPPAGRAATVAHLSATVYVDSGHSVRHMARAQTAPDHKSFLFDLGHAISHITGALEHERKLISNLNGYYRDVAEQLDRIGGLTGLGSRSPLDEDRASASLAKCRQCWGPVVAGVCADCEWRSAEAAERAQLDAYAEQAKQFTRSSRWEGALQ